jgi:16S rRNA (cytidine1402-2'-O)-methyltransferase
MFGKLYIVATPIGNLEDITLRALKTLKEVDFVLAEDTRVASKLLMHYEIDIPTLSYHQHSSDSKKFEILKMLLEGKDLALVTDAGTPGISDPGNELIDFILEKEPNIKIIPIPGASAITTALSVSGFKAFNFIFLGFLAKKGNTKLFEWLKEGKITFSFYESPKRILKTLKALGENFGFDTQVCIASELTKMHENLYRGSIAEVASKLEKSVLKGEMVVIVSL